MIQIIQNIDYLYIMYESMNVNRYKIFYQWYKYWLEDDIEIKKLIFWSTPFIFLAPRQCSCRFRLRLSVSLYGRRCGSERRAASIRRVIAVDAPQPSTEHLRASDLRRTQLAVQTPRYHAVAVRAWWTYAPLRVRFGIVSQAWWFDIIR